MSLGFTACSDNNENEKTIPEGTSEVTISENNIEVTSQNVSTWTQYAMAVANLLAKDASDLNEAWAVSYKSDEPYALTFKNFGGEYQSAAACVQQIVDGCVDIASEVGTSKIGEPRDLWEAGKYTEAVFAVESWYSWHSIDDYSNNILSIRNAFNGSRNNMEANHSLAAFTKAKNAEHAAAKQAIRDARQDFEMSCATRAYPAELQCDNLNFEAWTSKSTYSSDREVNGWSFLIGNDGKQWDVAPNAAFKKGHSAGIWRGTSVGPNGKAVKKIMVDGKAVENTESAAYIAGYTAAQGGISSDHLPMVIADGKTIDINKMKEIDPKTIESMTVLKDKAAIKQYGEKAKDGVIIITTKK